MDDFFDGLTVYLETEELLDEYLEKNTSRVALQKTKMSMLRKYKGERDMVILCLMSLYRLYLQNNIKNPEIQKELESLSIDEIKEYFSLEDAEKVSSGIKELLSIKSKPKARKNNFKCSITASWEKGDVYAYRLKGEKAHSSGLSGKYILLYVFDNKKSKTLTAMFYCLLYSPEKIEKDAKTVLDEAVFFKHCINNNYRYVLLDDNNDFPTANVQYIGKVLPVITPTDEIIPPSDLYYRYTMWSDFEDSMIKSIQKFLKI